MFSAASIGIGSHRGYERNDELFTLPTGLMTCHDLTIYQDKYAIITTRDSNFSTPAVPNAVLKLDVDNFSNYSIYNFPPTLPNISNPARINSHTIIGDTLYMAPTCNFAQTSPIVIFTFDIPTMTMGPQIVYTPTNVPAGNYGPFNGNVTSDGVRYLYYLSSEPRATIYKFDTWNSNTMVTQWLSNPLIVGRGHAIKYFNGMLYASSNQGFTTAGGLPAFNWVVKVDPVTMTEVARNILGPAGVDTSAPPTDDWCIANGKIYLSIDTNIGANQTPTGNIIILDANDLSYISSISEPTVNGGKGYSFVSGYDGTYVYAGVVTDPGKMLKINPIDDTYTILNLGAAVISPNEIDFSKNKGVAFITYAMATAFPYGTIKFGRYYNL